MNISIKSSNEICIATDAGLKSDTILEEVKIENFNKKNMINVCGDEMAMSTLSVIPSHDLNSRDSRELDEGLQFVESLNESPFSKKCGELKDELCNILADNPTLGISFVRSTTVENGNVVFEFKLNFFQELRDLLNDSDVETLSSFIDKNLSPELKNERVQKLRNIFKRNGVKCYCIEKNDKRCMSFMGDNTFFKNLILRDDTSLESFKKIFSDTYEKSFEDYCNDTKNLSKILDHSLDRLNVCMNYVCAHVWKDKNCPRIYRTLSADNTVVRVFFRENPQIQVSNMVKICCSKWKDAPENNFGVDNIGYITYEGIFNGFRIKAETLYKQGILAEDKKNRLIRYFNYLESMVLDPAKAKELVTDFIKNFCEDDIEVLRLTDETILTTSDKDYTQYQKMPDVIGLVRLIKKNEKPDIVVDKKDVSGLPLKIPLKKVSKQEARVESNNFSKIYVNTNYGVLRSVRPGESVDVYVSKNLSDGSSVLCPAKKIKIAEDDLFADEKFFEKVDENIRLEIKERLEKSLHVLAQSRLIRSILALAICAKNIVVASGVHHFELNWGDQDKEFAACVSEPGTNRCTSLFINHSKCDSIISLRLPMLRKDVDIENLIVIFHEFKHLIFNALFGDITINFNNEWSDANELGANLNFIRTLIGESRDENLSSDDVIELFSSIFSGDNGQYDQIEMEQIIGLFSFTNNNEKEDGKCKNSVMFDTLNDFFIQKEVCSILAKTEYTHINENAICLRSSHDQPRARLSDVMTLDITNALPRLKVFFSDLAEEITRKKIKMSEEEDESDDSLEVYGLAVERISRFLNTIENLRDIFEVTPGEIYQKGEEQGKKDNRSPEEVIMNIRKILYWVVDIGVTWSPELTRFYSEIVGIDQKKIRQYLNRHHANLVIRFLDETLPKLTVKGIVDERLK